MYQITIIEIPNAPYAPGAAPIALGAAEAKPGDPTLSLGVTERFRQTLDELDVSAVIRLVNAPARKKRADAGKGKKPTA